MARQHRRYNALSLSGPGAGDKNGAQFIVRESQAAVFVHEGQVADVFGPGRYTIDGGNTPILSKIGAWKYGFNSPFKSEVYFVNTNSSPT